MSRRDNFNDILTDRRQLSFEITARGEDTGGGHVRSQPRLRRLGVNIRMHSLRDTVVSRRPSRLFYPPHARPVRTRRVNRRDGILLTRHLTTPSHPSHAGIADATRTSPRRRSARRAGYPPSRATTRRPTSTPSSCPRSPRARGPCSKRCTSRAPTGSRAGSSRLTSRRARSRCSRGSWASPSRSRRCGRRTARGSTAWTCASAGSTPRSNCEPNTRGGTSVS